MTFFSLIYFETVEEGVEGELQLLDSENTYTFITVDFFIA